MVDTLNVTRQMERNATLGISDFYLVEHLDGKVEFAGTMDLERVLDLVKSKVLVTKSCDMWAWVPDSAGTLQSNNRRLIGCLKSFTRSAEFNRSRLSDLLEKPKSK